MSNEQNAAGVPAVQILDEILGTLNRANEAGLITDTIWHGPAETLWDFIQNSRDQPAAAPQPEAAPAAASVPAFTFTGDPWSVDANSFDLAAMCATCGCRWGLHYGAMCPAKDGRTFHPAPAPAEG